jgi:acetylornithine deacetylase/succinyl-diaminopimelate desuccinylase-like protein
MSQPLIYAQAHHDEYLDELSDFLRLPSVSTQPAHTSDVAATAAWLAGKLRDAGLENVQILETAGHPLVYGDWLHAGPEAPTLLVYGHYDVQPVEPLELWETPPFDPTLKGDHLFARGASDDKGQVFTHVKAVEAYLKTDGSLPLNVKFIIEGEEEIGSPNLANFIPGHHDLLAADALLVSDTAILNPEQPALVYSLRGMCYILMDITGADHDLHSGSFGGGINNPINVLGHLIARLKDENGRVLIPGFYDRVRPLPEDERALLAEFPLDATAWLREAGAPAVWGEPEYTLVERLGARPTLDVNGIVGGYTGPGRKTVLPSTVHAKISMRLVPDQDPAEIGDLFRRYVESLLPSSVTAKIEVAGMGQPAVVDYRSAACQAAAAAYEAAFGRWPVYMREGGSIPIVSQFQQEMKMQPILMGFGLPGDRLHSPNERFYLPNFYRGIDASIHFLAQYARRA